MLALLRFLYISAVCFCKVKQHPQSHVRIPRTLSFNKHNKLCFTVFIDDKTKVIENIVYQHSIQRLQSNILFCNSCILRVQFLIKFKNISNIEKSFVNTLSFDLRFAVCPDTISSSAIVSSPGVFLT